ncbi:MULTISPECIES: phage tail protein [unclassified Pseudomonas]|uniref:phage tail protein n=1 Tax=unclassified Pseudomonas TaxID=196821 RepID=UPI000A1DCB27|nr:MULTISPECIES: phage tail protein [unclassified Pseudomonas]
MVDKNSIFGGMLTALGAAKKTNCDSLGIPWEPRYMLIGDANGTDPVPSPSQTKLVNQVYRAQLNQLRVSPTDANVLIAELVLPPEVGGWWIRELALEDKDGVFCAVANAAPSYKPLLAQGSGRNQVVRMHIITSGTSNIQLKIDPSVVLATRGYVDDLFTGLLPPNKPAGTYAKCTFNSRGVFVSGENPTTLAGFGITDTYTKTQIEAMIAQASALPVGATVAFPAGVVPPGYLEADGSLFPDALYPHLAAHLSKKFNIAGDDASYTRLPDTRGEFLRGWDHGRGVDAGRQIGSLQSDALQEHWHTVLTPGTGSVMPTDGNITTFEFPTVSFGKGGPVNGRILATGVMGARLATETRGRNLAVMWCIKAWNTPVNQGTIDIAELAARTGRYIGTQVITDTRQYIPTPGMKFVRVRAGGGGGGSSGTLATTSTQTACSGGGASGSYGEGWFTAAQVGASLLVTIGDGGAAGLIGQDGTKGGTTSFGALLTAPGGGPSQVWNPVSTSTSALWPGGKPGPAAEGGSVLSMAGMSGGCGMSVAGSIIPGLGGSSPIGSSGYTDMTANPCTGYCAGASGISATTSTAAKVGAKGGKGVCFIEEYA